MDMHMGIDQAWEQSFAGTVDDGSLANGKVRANFLDLALFNQNVCFRNYFYAIKHTDFLKKHRRGLRMSDNRKKQP